MLDSVKPGQKLRLKVASVPRRQDDVQTIERLMRCDTANRRALKRAQQSRRVNARFKTRGGRPWQIRERPAAVVRVRPGAEWEMTWVPQLDDDLKAVADYLEVGKA